MTCFFPFLLPSNAPFEEEVSWNWKEVLPRVEFCEIAPSSCAKEQSLLRFNLPCNCSCCFLDKCSTCFNLSFVSCNSCLIRKSFVSQFGSVHNDERFCIAISDFLLLTPSEPSSDVSGKLSEVAILCNRQGERKKSENDQLRKRETESRERNRR